MTSENNDLNSRQQRFCVEYAKGKSATQAYIDSGYNPKNRYYAGISAYHLLEQTKIEKEWKRIKNIREARTTARKNTAVAEALGLALSEFSEMRKIIDKIKDDRELTKDQRMYFSSIMSIISSLSREDVVKIQQSQAQGQAQGQGTTLSDIHEMAEDYMENDDED